MSLSLSLLTRDSHSVLTNAHRIAKEHQQCLVTPHHLLLGLLELAGCQGEGVLTQFPLKLSNLKAQVLALVRVDAKETSVDGEGSAQGKSQFLSEDSTNVLGEAVKEAQEQGLLFVDTRLLLLGMLRHPDNDAGNLLRQYDIDLEAFRERARLKDLPAVDLPRVKVPSSSALPPIELSPVFLGLVGWVVFFGYLSYSGIGGNPTASALFFLLGGAVLCVAIHEFGHALVAYLGGDKSVVDKGYLTLNPLKYAHPVLSIAFPLIFLLMGGLPLPGGAVYINHLAIRGRGMRSLMSAAGPLGTLLCVIILAIPFALGLHRGAVGTHADFWAAMAALLLVELAALFLNLLPIPGLDGFGIIEPFLERSLAERIGMLRQFTFFFMFLLFRMPFLLRPLWMLVWTILGLLNMNLPYLAQEGLALSMPWME
ncbi:MAG: hypothetical protein H0T73_09530 [Ardenticatenales bacterium]|nr:hypothetical protein [Ardenticatenales bacterium]